MLYSKSCICKFENVRVITISPKDVNKPITYQNCTRIFPKPRLHWWSYTVSITKHFLSLQIFFFCATCVASLPLSEDSTTQRPDQKSTTESTVSPTTKNNQVSIKSTQDETGETLLTQEQEAFILIPIKTNTGQRQQRWSQYRVLPMREVLAPEVFGGLQYDYKVNDVYRFRKQAPSSRRGSNRRPSSSNRIRNRNSDSNRRVPSYIANSEFMHVP